MPSYSPKEYQPPDAIFPAGFPSEDCEVDLEDRVETIACPNRRTIQIERNDAGEVVLVEWGNPAERRVTYNFEDAPNAIVFTKMTNQEHFRERVSTFDDELREVSRHTVSISADGDEREEFLKFVYADDGSLSLVETESGQGGLAVYRYTSVGGTLFEAVDADADGKFAAEQQIGGCCAASCIGI